MTMNIFFSFLSGFFLNLHGKKWWTLELPFILFFSACVKIYVHCELKNSGLCG